MYKIFLFQKNNGEVPLLDYLNELSQGGGKDNRIKLKKILEYVRALRQYGTALGEPYIKHLEGELWELRPLRGRIVFVAWVDDSYVLLHHFIKKTQKTPVREIEQAKRELAELKERRMVHELQHDRP
ncbi:MAG: type II toxin-antitoxin system RelE/ParE family toxin [Oscillospiraceae bacterium]|nr:type II toxin-antitoxin system RelE/ParE family toxin [Oscillospiraceae bacterium]